MQKVLTSENAETSWLCSSLNRESISPLQGTGSIMKEGSKNLRASVLETEIVIWNAIFGYYISVVPTHSQQQRLSGHDPHKTPSTVHHGRGGP